MAKVRTFLSAVAERDALIDLMAKRWTNEEIEALAHYLVYGAQAEHVPIKLVAAQNALIKAGGLDLEYPDLFARPDAHQTPLL